MGCTQASIPGVALKSIPPFLAVLAASCGISNFHIYVDKPPCILTVGGGGGGQGFLGSGTLLSEELTSNAQTLTLVCSSFWNLLWWFL